MSEKWPKDHEIVRCKDPVTGEECWYLFMEHPLDNGSIEHISREAQDMAAKGKPSYSLTENETCETSRICAFPKTEKPPVPGEPLQESRYEEKARAMTREIEGLFEQSIQEAGGFEPALRLLDAAMRQVRAFIPLQEKKGW